MKTQLAVSRSVRVEGEVWGVRGVAIAIAVMMFVLVPVVGSAFDETLPEEWGDGSTSNGWGFMIWDDVKAEAEFDTEDVHTTVFTKCRVVVDSNDDYMGSVSPINISGRFQAVCNNENDDAASDEMQHYIGVYGDSGLDLKNNVDLANYGGIATANTVLDGIGSLTGVWGKSFLSDIYGTMSPSITPYRNKVSGDILMQGGVFQAYPMSREGGDGNSDLTVIGVMGKTAYNCDEVVANDATLGANIVEAFGGLFAAGIQREEDDDDTNNTSGGDAKIEKAFGVAAHVMLAEPDPEDEDETQGEITTAYALYGRIEDPGSNIGTAYSLYGIGDVSIGADADNNGLIDNEVFAIDTVNEEVTVAGDLEVEGNNSVGGILTLGGATPATAYELPNAGGTVNNVLAADSNGDAVWSSNYPTKSQSETIGGAWTFSNTVTANSGVTIPSGQTLDLGTDSNGSIGRSYSNVELKSNGSTKIMADAFDNDTGGEVQMYTRGTKRFSVNQYGFADFSGDTRVQEDFIVNQNVAIGSGLSSAMSSYELYLDGVMALSTYAINGMTQLSYGRGLIWSELVAGSPNHAEIHVMDGNANETVISPHHFELFEPDPDESLPWSYYSENPLIGKKINVDMTGAIRAIEALTGKQFIYEAELEEEDKIDADEYLAEWKTDAVREAKMKVIAENPWVEVTMKDALEEVPETVTVVRYERKTRYQLNLATRTIEPVEKAVRVEETVETGSKTSRLKEGVRFDETNGKFFRKRTLDDVVLEEEPVVQLGKYVLDRLPKAGAK